MRVLVATDSVHTTAAACDYLDGHVGPADEVVVLTVDENGARDDRTRGSERVHRDGTDALNVATVRLLEPTVDTLRRPGTPADEILATAAERDVDELVVGPRGGTPGSDSTVGETTRRVLAGADVPVVVVPLPDLDESRRNRDV